MRATARPNTAEKNRLTSTARAKSRSNDRTKRENRRGTRQRGRVERHAQTQPRGPTTRREKVRKHKTFFGWLVSDRPRVGRAAQRNGRRHSPLGSHRPSRFLSALLVSTGRATGHAHFLRLRSDLLRLDTTATRTRRRRAAASDRNRAKKKHVRPRVTLRIDRRPKPVLPFFRVSSLPIIRFSPLVVDRETTLLLGVICHCSCLGTAAAGCRRTTAPTTDNATAGSSPAEDGATNPRRRTALGARQMMARWPAGCCRDLACRGGCCFLCAAGLGDRQ